jgi:hypothetical protein
MGAFIVICLFVAFLVFIVKSYGKQMSGQGSDVTALLSPEEKAAYLYNAQEQSRIAALRRQDTHDQYYYGPRNPHMLCPHCASRGYIRTKHVVLKRGVSGGKATAALMTGGLSMLAVGLSRKEAQTQAWCGNCKNSWLF